MEKCAYISVNSYVTIVYLPLISALISIMQTLLGRSDLERWLKVRVTEQSLKDKIFCNNLLLFDRVN